MWSEGQAATKGLLRRCSKRASREGHGKRKSRSLYGNPANYDKSSRRLIAGSGATSRELDANLVMNVRNPMESFVREEVKRNLFMLNSRNRVRMMMKDGTRTFHNSVIDLVRRTVPNMMQSIKIFSFMINCWIRRHVEFMRIQFPLLSTQLGCLIIEMKLWRWTSSFEDSRLKIKPKDQSDEITSNSMLKVDHSAWAMPR